jgi:hypothetical protein
MHLIVQETLYFFLFNLCGGTLGTAATTGLLYQPRMIGVGGCAELVRGCVLCQTSCQLNVKCHICIQLNFNPTAEFKTQPHKLIFRESVYFPKVRNGYLGFSVSRLCLGILAPFFHCLLILFTLDCVVNCRPHGNQDRDTLT